MFAFNESLFDGFTIAHVLGALWMGYEGWRLAGPKGLWAMVALMVVWEPLEVFLAKGLRVSFFDETPLNALGDILVDIPSALAGAWLGRAVLAGAAAMARNLRPRRRRARAAQAA